MNELDYSRELNKGLKIFSKLFVGLSERRNGALGFAAPYVNAGIVNS